MQRFVLLSVALLASCTLALVADDDQCMLMSSMTAVSFEQGMTTTRRRGPNVPKLNCQGNCPDAAYLSGAQCTQTGLSDNGLPSWKCVGNFPGSSGREQYALGSIKVQCEGCTKAGDPNVVKGSCALTYSVKSRSAGRRHHHHETAEFDWVPVLLLLFIACGCYVCATRQSNYTKYVEPAYGVPVGAQGGAQVHHHYGGGYGYGGSGFGTGMLTGYVMGSALSGAHHGGGYYGGYDDAGYSGGGGSWSDGGGGFGGSDSV